MIARQGPSCAEHRSALLDFVDRREWSSTTEAALAHLDRCPSCESELAEIVLMIAALRRIAAEARAVRPPPDAWSRLRSRIDRPRPPAWVGRLSLGSLMLTAAVVAMVLAPSVAWRNPGSAFEEAGTDPAVVARQIHRTMKADLLIENRFINTRPQAPQVVQITPWRGPKPRPDPEFAREQTEAAASIAIAPTIIRAE